MTKKMLVDATHPEETRVVVVQNQQLVDFDFESSTKRQLKGNVYLAKVTRVEPSLQAAFVEYGGNRHGFLAFSEIHPDYYQIPAADRAILEQAEAETGKQAAADANDADEDDADGPSSVTEDADEETAEEMSAIAKKRAKLLRSYKIQEVIKRRQVMLVQVVKEERGNKGAALTTYLSLAGRYCVLMPNTARGGGISRKIASGDDRKRLKSVIQDLEVPKGMGLIVRTAGQERSRTEIRRDYDYLLRLWNEVRETTLKSVAPALIYEEGSLIKRAMRDLYSRDIEEVLVEGDDAYRDAKRLMQMMTPSKARQVKHYKDELPLFFKHKVEDQLDAMHSPVVGLPSGGSIVIHTTEALTAIDVNSGRSTRERHIDETAVKTNLEAADEVARQLRLRDLAGLIVIDFIDMSEGRHQRQVEKRLRDALKQDRARIQLGKISVFGLMELSRQRLRPSLQELSSQLCPSCQGLGVIRSTESCALNALRRIEEEAIKGGCAVMQATMPGDVALYLLNQKREGLVRLEQRYDVRVMVAVDSSLMHSDVVFQALEKRDPAEVAQPEAEAERPAVAADVEERQEQPSPQAAAGEDEEGRSKRRRRRRRRGRDEEALQADQPERAEAADADADGEEAPRLDQDDREEGEEEGVERSADAEGDDDGKSRRRRRRGRRGGRRREGGEADAASAEAGGNALVDDQDTGTDDRTAEVASVGQDTPPELAPEAPPEAVAAAALDPDPAADHVIEVEAPADDAPVQEADAEPAEAAFEETQETPAVATVEGASSGEALETGTVDPLPVADETAPPVQPAPDDVAEPAQARNGANGNGADHADEEDLESGESNVQAEPAASQPERQGWWSRWVR